MIFLQTICSCDNEQRDVTFHVTNKALIAYISLYRDKIETENKKRILQGDSVYVGVYAKNCNDSIKRYIIYPIVDCRQLNYDVPFVVCTINGHSTFFSSMDFAPYHYGDSVFFNLHRSDQLVVMKKYFPNSYKEYKKNGGLSNWYIYEPHNYYLTYVKDSLVDVTYKHGTHLDKIKLCINGKDVYL